MRRVLLVGRRLTQWETKIAKQPITLLLERATLDLLVTAAAIAANRTKIWITANQLDALNEALSRVLVEVDAGEQKEAYRITVQRC